jgi:RNA polymerase sigma-70 factor (ECF subfamily)
MNTLSSTLDQDALLLSRLKSGDPKAVQSWFQQYHDKLFSLVCHKISNEKDAEELVQDTFLSCLKHLPLFRGESSIWTWMARICQHEVADYYRKRYAKKFIHAFPLSELLLAEPVYDSHEVSQKVKKVLHTMANEEREILLMKYVDKKKVKQIAQELGKTVKSVESILFRARIEFRDLYALEEE